METTTIFALALGIYALGKLFMLFVFPRILKRWFTHEHRLSSEEGYVATQDHSAFLGREGVARTDLRPSGRASFGDEVLDVASAEGFIPRGSPVVVTEVRGNNIFVKQK